MRYGLYASIYSTQNCTFTGFFSIRLRIKDSTLGSLPDSVIGPTCHNIDNFSMQIKGNVLLYLHVKYNQLKQIYTETLDEEQTTCTLNNWICVKSSDN